MFKVINKSIKDARARRMARQNHRDVTRTLDSLALTELGFSPGDYIGKVKRRGFFH